MNVTLDEIKRLIGLQLGVRHVNEADALMADLGAESVDIVNIIVAVEDRYNLAVDEAELAALRTVHDLYDLVQRRLKEG